LLCGKNDLRKKKDYELFVTLNKKKESEILATNNTKIVIINFGRGSSCRNCWRYFVTFYIVWHLGPWLDSGLGLASKLVIAY
jgi:hypothetical protein